MKKNKIIIFAIFTLIALLFCIFLININKKNSYDKNILEFNNTIGDKKDNVLTNSDVIEINNLKSQDIPVFMYHNVTDDLSYIEYPINAVSVTSFKEQMKAIKDSGYDSIFISQISKSHIYEKPIVLTFDDGFKDFYLNAFPILKEYNIKATLYMITGYIGGEFYCNMDQLIEMQNSGLVEIETHTYSHRNLATLSLEGLSKELIDSKKVITDSIKSSGSSICYPYGGYNTKVLEIVKDKFDYGIAMTEGLYNIKKHSKYEIPRISVTRYTNISTFKLNIAKSKKYY